VKVLRNVVKIKTGKTTKLTKNKICEAYTNIQAGKLPLPPLVLTSDRTYLLDKNSPLSSSDYDKLFDKSSSRVILKKIAAKISIKKVEALTKSQLVDTILKRLKFLDISEPIKLGKRQSSPVTAVKAPIAVKAPAAVQTTVVKAPAAVQTTAAKILSTITGNVNTKDTKITKNNVSEQGKTLLGNRNYDLLFDPTTKRDELVRIAKKVGIVEVDTMTKKELIEATTKRVRFMSNRGLTPKTMKTANVPFFPKPNTRPPPITTPAFLQQKASVGGGPPTGGPPTGGPPTGGVPSFLNGRRVVPTPPLPPTPGPPRPPNVKPNNVKPVVPNRSNNKVPNNKVPNNKVPNNKVPNNNVPNNKVPNNMVPNNKVPNNNVPNNKVPNNGISGNTPPAKKGKSFFNYFKGGKKNAVPQLVRQNAMKQPAKKGKSFMNYFKGGKKNTTVDTMVNDMVNNAVINEVNNEALVVAKNEALVVAKNEAVENMTEDVVVNAIINEVNKGVKLNPKNLTNEIVQEMRKNIDTSINKTNVTRAKKVNTVAENMTDDVTVNAVFREVNREVKLNSVSKKNRVNVNVNSLSDEIAEEIVNKMITTNNVNKVNKVNKVKKEIRRGGRAAENVNKLTNEILNKLKNDISSNIVKKPIYNNLSNSNNNNNKTTKINNPVFEPNMKNNPIFNNKNSESTELSNHINNLGLPNANKKKLMNLFNTTNQTLGNAKRNATTLSNTRKLQNSLSNANNNNNGEISATSLTLNSERNRLKNKITRELNLRPDNEGVFIERRGPLKGKIGIWARELRKAETLGDLKNIENKLNEKTSLRKDIENKYTKMGLTKVEKMNHRRKVVKFVNNVDERRKLVEIQVKNKNNNTNSVVSNYNSNANANSNEAKKMKYGSRENFINAKKVELRELAKNTSTNFGRNINRMESRTNVTKLRGRIEGAIRRNESMKKVNTRPRSERRVDNRAVLKNLKKKVKKNNPRFSPAKVNAEARRLRDLSKR
tara:strand:- start:2521 stop:5496 length:2976 start_codon:yes stop_codon:yes gene_type:complete